MGSSSPGSPLLLRDLNLVAPVVEPVCLDADMGEGELGPAGLKTSVQVEYFQDVRSNLAGIVSGVISPARVLQQPRHSELAEVR